MLLLLFRSSDGRYALESHNIIEIVPRVRTKAVPAAPGYVAGMINYQGTPVPVFDLQVLEGGEPCRPLFSTRIILVRYPLDDEEIPIGILAEGVTDVIRCGDDEVRSTGILLDREEGARSGVPTGREEIVQLFDVARMIPEDVVRQLR